MKSILRCSRNNFYTERNQRLSIYKPEKYIAVVTTKKDYGICNRQTFINGNVNFFPASRFHWRCSLRCVVIKSDQRNYPEQFKRLKRMSLNRRFHNIVPKKVSRIVRTIKANERISKLKLLFSFVSSVRRQFCIFLYSFLFL